MSSENRQYLFLTVHGLYNQIFGGMTRKQTVAIATWCGYDSGSDLLPLFRQRRLVTRDDGRWVA